MDYLLKFQSPKTVGRERRMYVCMYFNIKYIHTIHTYLQYKYIKKRKE